MGNVYAIVEGNVVTNIVLWDGAEKWAPAQGVAHPAPPETGIGWGYIDGQFIAQPPPFDYSETEENPKDERDIEEFTPSAVQTQ
ncbi:hypothetical protein P2P35_08585 [Escherichia coli]|nr:hypothetical protein [Escherichia coli]